MSACCLVLHFGPFATAAARCAAWCLHGTSARFPSHPAAAGCTNPRLAVKGLHRSQLAPGRACCAASRGCVLKRCQVGRKQQGGGGAVAVNPLHARRGGRVRAAERHKLALVSQSNVVSLPGRLATPTKGRSGPLPKVTARRRRRRRARRASTHARSLNPPTPRSHNSTGPPCPLAPPERSPPAARRRCGGHGVRARAHERGRIRGHPTSPASGWSLNIPTGPGSY